MHSHFYSDNNIGDNEAQYLSEALKVNNTLTTIYLPSKYLYKNCTLISIQTTTLETMELNICQKH